MGINLGPLGEYRNISSTDLLLMCEKSLDSYDTVKIYYNRVLLAESFFNSNIRVMFIFFNPNVFPNTPTREIKYSSYVEGFDITNQKVQIVGSVMKEIKKNGVEYDLFNRTSYDDYKKSYDIFDECFNPNNNRVWKI